MKKKLMVAGCSFSAPSKDLPGTSWSEVLAKRLDWDLVNLARQGCSNGGIRIQIEEIRRQRPDFAVVSPTFWDRMEIPAGAAPYDWSIEGGGWDPKLQQHLQDRTLKNGYDRAEGINNVPCIGLHTKIDAEHWHCVIVRVEKDNTPPSETIDFNIGFYTYMTVGADGFYEFYMQQTFVGAGTIFMNFDPTSDFIGCIDNISVESCTAKEYVVSFFDSNGNFIASSNSMSIKNKLPIVCPVFVPAKIILSESPVFKQFMQLSIRNDATIKES
jgi:hypothetical protein